MALTLRNMRLAVLVLSPDKKMPHLFTNNNYLWEKLYSDARMPVFRRVNVWPP
jgi:hypothetical protein